MSTMQAIEITAPGGPEVLEVRDVPAPEAGPGEILVRVRAVGVNRADLLQRRGFYPAPPGAPERIPGLEYAGEVERVGPGVEGWRPGDGVMGIIGGGAYAELVVVDAREALPVPAGLAWEEAAAIPEAFITAHDALFTLLGLESGQDLLVHAIGSGVGLAALQLAKAAGARVFGTSRSSWKLERAGEYGLDLPIPTGGEAGEEFDEVIRRETGGRGVDAVLDLVGGAYLAGNLRALARRGKAVVVGLVAGRRAELDLGMLLSKRLTLIGTVLRSRSLEEKVAAARAFREGALHLFEEGRLRPIVDRVFPFAEAGAAHEYMEGNRNFGKVVLVW